MSFPFNEEAIPGRYNISYRTRDPHRGDPKREVEVLRPEFVILYRAATTIIVTEQLPQAGTENQSYIVVDAPSGTGSDDRLFAGHLGVSNYLFADGHVKSTRPFATIDSAAGGSSSMNMWTLNNKPFAAAASSTTAKANLETVTNRYK